MRLIDADALLKDIRDHSQSYFADDFAEEWVDRQPTIYPEPSKTGKWIPCKEKLPQEDEPVLVTDDAGNQHVWNITRAPSEYLDGLCWEDDYGYYQDLDDAVAWQPLPEPYNEEDDNCGVRKEGQNVDAFT